MEQGHIPQELVDVLYAAAGVVITGACAWLKRRFDIKNHYDRKKKDE